MKAFLFLLLVLLTVPGGSIFVQWVLARVPGQKPEDGL